MPVAWDDPSRSEDLNQILVDLFNQAGRGTLTKDVEVPKTIPLVSINESNLKSILRLVCLMYPFLHIFSCTIVCLLHFDIKEAKRHREQKCLKHEHNALT